MKADGTVIIDTLFDTDGFGKGMNIAEKQMNGFKSSVAKLGRAIAAAFAITKIIQFGKEAIELGSDLQEVQNVVDVTFTTMSDQVNKFAKNAAKAAGLSETMAKRYIGTFGAMSKSFGFMESEAFAMSSTLTQAVGDVASFYNLTQDEAYTKLKSVFTGETESLKDLGVVMTQSALDSYAMANGFEKTTSAMTEQEKVSLRYQFVLDQLSAAQGDFARTSTGWANQMRILNLNIETLKANIGQGLINAFTPLLKILNSVIERMALAAEYFRVFTEIVFGKQESGGSAMTAELKEIQEGYEGVAASTEKAAKAQKNLLSGFDELNVAAEESSSGSASGGSGGLQVGIVPGAESESSESQIDISKLETIAERVKSIFGGIKDFLVTNKEAIIAIVSGLVAGIVSLFTMAKWGNIVSTVSGIILKVVSVFGGLASGITAPIIAIAAIIGLIVAAIVDLWNTSDTFRDNMKQAWELISIAVKKAWEMLWTNGLKPLIDALVQLGITLYDFYENSGLKTIFEFIVTGVTWVATILGSVLVTALSGVLSVALNVVTGLIKAFTSIISKITWVAQNWKQIWNGIKQTGSEIIKKISTGITQTIENMKQNIRKKLLAISLFFATIFNSIRIRVTSIFKNMWTGIKNVINSIIGGINKMTSSVVTGINAVIKALNGLSFDIPDWVPEFGGKTFGFNIGYLTAPQIPYLATGAVIPPNAPFTAVLGDQNHGKNLEAPEDLIRKIVREESGNAELLALLSEIAKNTRDAADKDLIIGDRAIARANARGQRAMGYSLVTEG